MELQDQRVLVTGATAGIGQETAKLFARRGATVVITGRDTERGAQTVAAIEAEGGRAEFIAADLNDIESVRRLAEQVGEVDVLVNNAAAHQSAPTLEQDVESFDMTFDVNVRAPFFLTAALLPQDDRPRIGCHRQHLHDGRVGRRRRRAGRPPPPRRHSNHSPGPGRRPSAPTGFVSTPSRPGPPAPTVPSARSATGWNSWAPRHRWAEPRTRPRSPRRSFSSRRQKPSYITGATVAVDGGYTAI